MKAVLGALALTLIAVGANAWLLRFDAARAVLTPDPPRVVQNFIGALAARRPGVAHELVARDARGELPETRLAALAADLRARHGTFRFAEAVEERLGDASRVRARLHTARSGDVQYVVDLARDPSSGLWKVVAMSA